MPHRRSGAVGVPPGELDQNPQGVNLAVPLEVVFVDRGRGAAGERPVGGEEAASDVAADGSEHGCADLGERDRWVGQHQVGEPDGEAGVGDELVAITAKVVAFVNENVPHVASEPTAAPVTYDEFHGAVAHLERMLKRYYLLINQAALITATPEIQDGCKAPFRRANRGSMTLKDATQNLRS